MSLLYRISAVFATRNSETGDAALVRTLQYRDARARKTLTRKHEQEADQNESKNKATRYIR